MNVVLDTNVLVSGLMSSGGTCSHILRLAGYEAFEPCLDSAILREYDEVLRRPELDIPSEDAEGILDLMREHCEEWSRTPLPTVLPDPKDEMFLEVAAASRAVLVTGNLKHFPPKSRSGVTVVTPAEFLDSLRRA